MSNQNNDKTHYDHGLPFSKKLAGSLDRQKDRVNGNKASLIIIDGGVGEGKTTLAVHCADYLTGAYVSIGKEKWEYHPENVASFEIQLGLGGVQFIKKLKLCFNNKRCVIIYDEAGDFNKRASLTKSNAMLNRIFETYRAYHIVVIIVLPLFNVLDQEIFDKKIPRLLINCYDRGQNQGHYRAYSLYRMLYIKEKMTHLVVKQQAYRFTTPNYWGHFRNLPNDRKKALDLISTEGKLLELQKVEVAMEGLVTYKEIGERIGRPLGSITCALSKMFIKPERYVGRVSYFREEVIDVLLKHYEESQTPQERFRREQAKKLKEEAEKREAAEADE